MGVYRRLLARHPYSLPGKIVREHVEEALAKGWVSEAYLTVDAPEMGYRIRLPLARGLRRHARASWRHRRAPTGHGSFADALTAWRAHCDLKVPAGRNRGERYVLLAKLVPDVYDITRNRMAVKLADEYAAECGRELSASDRTSIQAQVASSGAATVVRWWSRR